jgi:hypothetical protein
MVHVRTYPILSGGRTNMTGSMIIKGEWGRFIDLPNEEILLVKRKHPFVIIFPLILIALFAFISFFGVFYILNNSFFSFPIYIASLFVILSSSISGAIFIAIYWYFHLYILTSRKILEVKYTPLFSHVVNDIFLDNVSCTEVDLKSSGFFHEIIDMGDITITFDRPTHQEEFTLSDIKDCDEIGKFLVQKLMNTANQSNGNIIWMRGKRGIVEEAAI